MHTSMVGGPTALTRFFLGYTGTVSATDATTLLGTIETSWISRLQPITGPQYSLSNVTLDDLDSRTGVQVALPTAHTGSALDQGVNAGVAFVMSAKVSLKYRGGHSRVYIPGMHVGGLQDVNSWTVGFQGTVFTAWTGLLADAAVSPPVAIGALSTKTVRYISSNKADFPPPPPSTFPALLPTPLVLTVNSWSSNPQVGSQRRRNQQGS